MHTSTLITMHMKFPCLWSLQNSNCCTRLPRLVPMGPTMGLTWWTAAAGHRVRERNVSDQLKKLSTCINFLLIWSPVPPRLVVRISDAAQSSPSALHHTRRHLPLVQIACDYAEQLRTATQSLAIAITWPETSHLHQQQVYHDFRHHGCCSTLSRVEAAIFIHNVFQPHRRTWLSRLISPYRTAACSRYQPNLHVWIHPCWLQLIGRFEPPARSVQHHRSSRRSPSWSTLHPVPPRTACATLLGMEHVHRASSWIFSLNLALVSLVRIIARKQ